MTLLREWLIVFHNYAMGRQCNASTSVKLWAPGTFLSQLLVIAWTSVARAEVKPELPSFGILGVVVEP